MKKSLIALGLLILVSCGASISDVEQGMTEAEVEEILGKPNKKNANTSTYTFNGETSETSSATWTYDGKGTIEFQDGIVASVSEN